VPSRVIANPHLYGAPVSENPAIVIRRDDAPELWRDHHAAFERQNSPYQICCHEVARGQHLGDLETTCENFP
jgi:hypothetical protein